MELSGSQERRGRRANEDATEGRACGHWLSGEGPWFTLTLHTNLVQVVEALPSPFVHVIVLSGLAVHLQWPRKHGELRTLRTALPLLL